MSNTTSIPPPSGLVEDSVAAKFGKTAGFGVLMLMSLIGNSLVILVIYKNRSMRTTSNYFIVSMAVSDILFSAFTMPRNIVETFWPRPRWFVSGWLGELLCKLVPFVQDVCTAVSILSMIAIAVDRFYGLTYPLKKSLFTGKFRRGVVLLTWVLAFSFHSPYFYTYKLSGSGDALFCVNTWEPAFDNRDASRAYFLTMSILLFLLPVAIVTLLYSAIIMNFKGQKFPGHQSLRNKKRIAQQNKGVVRMLVAVVVVFVVCWLPFNVIVYVLFFHWTSGPPPGFETLMFCVLFLAYSNSSISPGLYFLFSQNFRVGLRKIFRRTDEAGLNFSERGVTRRSRATPPPSPRVNLRRGVKFESDV